MATRLYDIKDLLGSLQGLESRQKQIQELRDQYFTALRSSDAPRQQEILRQAGDAKIELFESLPLSDVNEVNAVRDLAATLRGDGAYLKSYESLLRLFHETKPTELRRDLAEIQRILAEFGPELVRADEARKKAQNLAADLIGLSGQLAKEVVQSRSLLAAASVVDALAALRAMSLETYTSRAAQQIQQAESSLADVTTPAELRAALMKDIQTARGDQTAWLQLRDSNPGLVERMQQIVARADRGLPIAAEDLAWLDSLTRMYAPVSGMLARVAAAARRDGALAGQRTGDAALGAAAEKWWKVWDKWANAKSVLGDVLPDKLRDINDVLKQLKDFQERDDLSQPDRELWLAWRRRVTQALMLAKALASLQPTPMAERFKDQEGRPGPYGFKPTLRRLNDWLARTDDEVFCLLEYEWTRAYDWLLKPKAGTATATPAETDDLNGRQRALEKAARGKGLVAWLVKVPRKPDATSGISPGISGAATPPLNPPQTPGVVSAPLPIGGLPLPPQRGSQPPGSAPRPTIAPEAKPAPVQPPGAAQGAAPPALSETPASVQGETATVAPTATPPSLGQPATPLSDSERAAMINSLPRTADGSHPSTGSRTEGLTS